LKYNLETANNFKRSFKKKKLTDDETMAYIEVMYKLLNDEELEEKYKDHNLKGNYQGYKECHIKPDLLLIYRIKDDILELVDIGTHSELF
jgi:mRNA interferase YafQ